MVIGVPKEIKTGENRVALHPAGAGLLARAGNTVYIQAGAGAGSGFEDTQYEKEGAVILPDAQSVYNKAELVMKVKEPLESEYGLLRENQTLFTYLHLAPNRSLTDALLKSRVTAFAYETVQTDAGFLPLLAPMSEVAGKMSVQIGARLLEKQNGGAGLLLGGVPGVTPASVVVIGGGIVGINAAKVAAGMGARVTVIELSNERLIYLDDIFSNRINTLKSNEYNIFSAVGDADLLIGAVLIAGARAPRLVSADMVKRMKKGSVIVDVAVDQGGCIETADRVTTHDNPTYEKFGVIHYSVANIPGAVPRTSTLALVNATMPYIISLTKTSAARLVSQSSEMRRGLNTCAGKVTNSAVAEAHGMDYTPPEKAFE